MDKITDSTEKATFAGGCFWCTEAIFKRVIGVISVTPGYIGGTKDNPTYDDVCSGKTGHVEAIEMIYDTALISFNQLLEIFWHVHDPTSKDRQGADSGTQYRSVIFFHTPMQKQLAEQSKESESQKIGTSIVTEILPATKFFPAESYHADYYAKNSYQGYCQIVIDPKISKLLTDFRTYVKPEYKTE